MKFAAGRAGAYVSLADAIASTADPHRRGAFFWRTFAEACARRVRNAAGALWAAARDGYEAYRRRMVADLLFTELSKLPDADLERRGMARADLGRLTRAMAAR